jgi:hypothetical protein
MEQGKIVEQGKHEELLHLGEFTPNSGISKLGNDQSLGKSLLWRLKQL